MSAIVLMPQLGISEESALLAKWNVKKGDEVKAGAKLFEIETGKASFEVESEYSGIVLEILHGEGEELPIKTPVCVIGQPGEKYELPTVPKAETKPKEQTASAPTQAQAFEAVSPVSGKNFASPRAKALAEKAGVDLSGIPASGPEGRIIERDVKAYLDAGRPAFEKKQEAAADCADRPFTRMRKVIADNMFSSLANSAQLTLNSSFDATALLKLRKRAKAEEIKGLEKVTIGDMILLAVARTLPEFPYINAHCLGESVREFSSANLAFACDTPKGLMVPVIWQAEKLGLARLSQRVKELAAACNAGTVPPGDLTGGSFTVSNLGSLGVENFTPVLNPPQVGILGVGCPVTRFKERDGNLASYTAIGLSLTFDHRAVDGAPAARFLKALCERLENIESIIEAEREA